MLNDMGFPNFQKGEPINNLMREIKKDLKNQRTRRLWVERLLGVLATINCSTNNVVINTSRTISSIMVLFMGVYSIESMTIYLSSGRSAVKNLVKTTIFKGLTIKSIPDTI